MGQPGGRWDIQQAQAQAQAQQNTAGLLNTGLLGTTSTTTHTVHDPAWWPQVGGLGGVTPGTYAQWTTPAPTTAPTAPTVTAVAPGWRVVVWRDPGALAEQAEGPEPRATAEVRAMVGVYVSVYGVPEEQSAQYVYAEGVQLRTGPSARVLGVLDPTAEFVAAEWAEQAQTAWRRSVSQAVMKKLVPKEKGPAVDPMMNAQP